MARECSVCGKKPGVGNNVSHSHRKTRRRFLPNLQKIRYVKDGVTERGYVCTQCIQKGLVTKAV